MARASMRTVTAGRGKSLHVDVRHGLGSLLSPTLTTRYVCAGPWGARSPEEMPDRLLPKKLKTHKTTNNPKLKCWTLGCAFA
ncbi:hypothetical protein J6590_013308 [Homalodisca vitripennis]|nr:hypothetical protein J6590_013308 [Homalodisca vitripennis]